MEIKVQKRKLRYRALGYLSKILGIFYESFAYSLSLLLLSLMICILYCGIAVLRIPNNIGEIDIDLIMEINN